jgi:6-phosphofructokinase
MVNKVAMLTAGGFAPCLSAAIGGLIERYTALAPDVEIIAYRYGYEGLLKVTRSPLRGSSANTRHASTPSADRPLEIPESSSPTHPTL